jgi:hypothetical protein
MIIYAYEKGHPIGLFTTLVGLSSTDAQRLKDIKFEIIFLHLPDSYGNANIPITSEYKEVLGFIMTTYPKIVYVSMNDFFQTNHRESLMRGRVTKRKKAPVECTKFKDPQFMVLPSGDVHLCCMDMGLQYKMGNLFKNTYDEIKKSGTYPKNICYYCDSSRTRSPFIITFISGLTKKIYRRMFSGE